MHTACSLSGLILLLMGSLDCAFGDVLSLRLSHLHNCAHLFTGLAALLVGQLATYSVARSFALVTGSIYLILGSLALFDPSSVATMLGHKTLLDAGTVLPDTLYHLFVAGVLFSPLLARYWSISPSMKMSLGRNCSSTPESRMSLARTLRVVTRSRARAS